jgi:hypothetical protein
MATLTLDPKRIPDGERSDRYIRECWRKMRVYLKREYGTSIDFISVMEFQQSGIAHLHILLSIYIPQAWLSDAWVKSGGGRIVDIRRFQKIHFVAAYLAGYLAGNKVANTLSLLPRRARIFSTSRSISLWGKKKQTAWKLSKKSLWNLRNTARSVSNERFESTESLKRFDLQLLTYFEALLMQQVLADRDVYDALNAFRPVWIPKPFQYGLL